MDCFEYFQNDSPLEKSKTFFFNFITKSKKLVFKKHTLCFQDDTLRYFKIFWQVVTKINHCSIGMESYFTSSNPKAFFQYSI